MRLYLVRHGVTAETGTVLTGRLPGVPLSEAGRSAARIVADRLGSHDIAAVYTSPIRRCKETARIVAAQHSLTPLTDHRLTEADYGSWAGRRLKDLYRLKGWGRLIAYPDRFRFPDGETLGEVLMRATSAVEELAERHGKSHVVVVSHSDVIRAILCHYLGAGIDHIHRLDVRPTSVSVIDLGADGAVAVSVVNQTFDGGSDRVAADQQGDSS